MGESLADRPLSEPHAERLSSLHPDYDQILKVHAEALLKGNVSYIDPPTGYSVMTAGFLAARGNCCDNGCRHCPYVE
jgi:hypothetical protein